MLVSRTTKRYRLPHLPQENGKKGHDAEKEDGLRNGFSAAYLSPTRPFQGMPHPHAPKDSQHHEYREPADDLEDRADAAGSVPIEKPGY